MRDALNRRPWLGAWAGCVLAIWWLAGVAHSEPNIYDEGLAVFGAVRVMAGELPQRDFWTIYPPGIFLLLSAVFSTFGTSLLVERYAFVLLGSALAVMSFRLAARFGGLLAAAWCTVVVLLWIRGLGVQASPSIPALILSLVAVVCLERFIGDERRRDLATAGLATAGAGLFRHDFALYTFVAIATTLTVLWHWRLLGTANALRVPAPLLYAASTAMAAASVAGWLVAVAGPHAVADQLVRFPLFVFPRFRELPVSHGILYYAPLALSGSAIVVGIRRIRATARVEGAVPFALGLMGLAFMNQARVRSDLFHVFPSLAISVTAFAAAVGRASPAGRRGSYTTAVLIVAAVIAGATLEALPRPPAAAYTFTLERAKGLRSSGDPAPYEDAVNEVRKLTQPGERIFVGNDRHDRIFINDVLFYFLSARPSATRYHELHPGVATTAEAQREIVDELERHHVRFVVLRQERHPPEHTNESSRSSGVVLLDRFIRERFRVHRRFGDYEIWQRR